VTNNETIERMYRAFLSQHDAIDYLFARVILLDREFRPSKTGPVWRALVEGNAAMAAAVDEFEFLTENELAKGA
jgi:hypothetical protein